MEFPRHLHKDNGQFVVVKDAEQYDACKANGWLDQPEAHVEQPVEVRYVDAIDGAASESDEPKKKGKGKKAESVN